MSEAWTFRKSVSESKQNPLRGSSHRRCRKKDGLEVAMHQQGDDSDVSLPKNVKSMAALELWQ